MLLNRCVRILSLLIVLVTLSELEAARGGGGRGGGGGRVSGGVSANRGAVNNYARTPSMSRSYDNRSRTGQNLRQLPSQQLPSAQRQNLQQNFRSNYGQMRNENRKLSDRATRDTRQRLNNNDLFGPRFFDRHDYRPDWYRPGVALWGAANWYGLNHWLGWGWSGPVYYDDSGYAIQVPSESVTGDSYSSTSSIMSAQGNWISLGVFAAARDAQSASTSNLFIQLMIAQTGDISGTYYNALTDKTQEIDGHVDRDTQQAMWRLSDNPDSPVIHAGLYNLTQDVVPVRVQYPNGVVQTWSLVRLRQ